MHESKAGDVVSIQTVNGSQYTVVYARTERGFDNGEVWIGYLQGYGTAYPVIISTYRGEISGTINTPQGRHRLKGPGDAAVLTDEVALREEPFIPTEDDGRPIPLDIDLSRVPMRSAVAVAAATGATPRIDIMVLYTPGFATTLGGDNAAISRANQLVATANTVFANSGINATLNLVYAGALNYPDDDVVSVATALDDITGYNGTGATHYDTSVATTVANLRSQYGADEVGLVRVFKSTTTTVCGLGWIGQPMQSGSAQYAFFVEDDIRTSGTAACDGAGTSAGDTGFTHELGHNLGALHDRATEANSPGTAYPSYNRGYCNGHAGTVMSYSSTTGCTPIVPYFSTPALSTACNGFDCGISSGTTFTAYGTAFTATGADSASGITFNAPYVANYVAAVVQPTGARSDFNGDGKADILWRNASTGQVIMWLMNGSSIIGQGLIYQDTNWTPIATGDFNGDGKADILWRNASTGQVIMWLMNGSSMIGQASIYQDVNWSPVATGDFNGDGKTDILWRNASTGQVIMWLMNGSSIIGQGLIYQDTNWTPIATGDFNGDGKADILWRNASTGQVIMWLMNGSSMIGQASIYQDVNWSPVATGDFNGDGKTDILWRNASTGQVIMWLMNGSSMIGQASIYQNPAWVPQ